LNIASYTDWYLPARDELELAWKNLKPVTNNNGIPPSVSPRPVSGIDYKNKGSPGDTSADYGVNYSADPVGTAYTSTVPAQTSVTAFQTGNSEAFDFGTVLGYWSSSEFSSTSGWRTYYYTGVAGTQFNAAKTTGPGSNYRIRAVRRSII
jgi:hypothetical protein